MDSIRINNGRERIEVNDEGEYIEIYSLDASFRKSFYDLVDWFNQLKERDDVKELQEQGSNGADEAIKKKECEVEAKINEELRERIDDIFGDEACRKIFGRKPPNLYTVSFFLDAITPYIEKYIQKHNTEVKEISKKYSKNRKGAKS